MNQLYHENREGLQKYCASEFNKDLLESESFDLWLAGTETCRREIKRLERLLRFQQEDVEERNKTIVKLQAEVEAARHPKVAPKTQYVLGFAFSEDLKEVLLINKTEPEWQKGCWNGIGGKVKPDESVRDAIYREAKEEAGLNIQWRSSLTFGGCEFNIWIYYGGGKLPRRHRCKEGPLRVFPVIALPHNCVINVEWMVAMCLAQIREKAGDLEVVQVED